MVVLCWSVCRYPCRCMVRSKDRRWETGSSPRLCRPGKQIARRACRRSARGRRGPSRQRDMQQQSASLRSRHINKRNNNCRLIAGCVPGHAWRKDMLSSAAPWLPHEEPKGAVLGSRGGPNKQSGLCWPNRRAAPGQQEKTGGSAIHYRSSPPGNR